ncbi:hypothetical protein LAZ67_X000569 [Cordylochernes scorpioides]|uniref:Uncharacterized protein n=1 Tax=Cordylochernes scorpioides TaxID=51811 RepID=A0ABY6LRP6_9ARAC|nr:hypothetical protein LAZ67_X000569 [Cordylochernes scorpioides]
MAQARLYPVSIVILATPVEEPKGSKACISIIKEAPSITYQQLEKSVGIGLAAVNTIINDYLKYRKLVSRLVPHSLTENQKLGRAYQRLFLNIITGDETWIYNFDPEKKLIYSGALQNHLLLRKFAERKVKSGFIDIVKLEDRKTVNSDLYTTKCLPEVFEKSSKADQELNLEESFFTMTKQDRTPQPKH